MLVGLTSACQDIPVIHTKQDIYIYKYGYRCVYCSLVAQVNCVILCGLIRQDGAAPGPFLLCCWPYKNAGI